MLIEKAKIFAIAAHEATGQKRKVTNEPYYIHPIGVAEIVASVTDDEEMIAAALLHDVVEDTEVTTALVGELFGHGVAQLVDELTDISKPEDGNRARRKEIDRNHTAQSSVRAKTIKLGDVIHNLSTIHHQKPSFAQVYIREKQLLLEVLTEGHPELYQRADSLIEQYLEVEASRVDEG